MNKRAREAIAIPPKPEAIKKLKKADGVVTTKTNITSPVSPKTESPTQLRGAINKTGNASRDVARTRFAEALQKPLVTPVKPNNDTFQKPEQTTDTQKEDKPEPGISSSNENNNNNTANEVVKETEGDMLIRVFMERESHISNSDEALDALLQQAIEIAEEIENDIHLCSKTQSVAIINIYERERECERAKVERNALFIIVAFNQLLIFTLTQIMFAVSLSVVIPLFSASDNNVDAKYKTKYRSLQFNLSHAKNAELRRRVFKLCDTAGALTGAELVAMDQRDLAPSELKQERERLSELKKQESMSPEQGLAMSATTTDQWRCSKCKQRKCTYYQLQTRSADEPMTTFVTCTVCGNRWKC